MGIDLKLMAKKFAQLSGDKSFADGKIWKPKEGDQTIRVLPTEDGDPFKELWFHYQVGKVSDFLCPKRNFGEACPVCEFAHKLWMEKDNESHSMAKKLFAKQRFFSPVIVRGEEKQGVKLWGYSKKVYEILLKYVLNPEYGDITNQDTGTDIVLTYGKAPGQEFANTTLQLKRQSSPLCPDKESGDCKEMLASIPTPSEEFANKRKTPEQVQQILNDYLGGDIESEEEIEKTLDAVDFGAMAGDKGAKKVGAASIDNAFNELLEGNQ